MVILALWFGLPVKNLSLWFSFFQPSGFGLTHQPEQQRLDFGENWNKIREIKKKIRKREKERKKERKKECSYVNGQKSKRHG